MEAKIHYHICWSDSSLDWQSFATKEEAMELAKTIKKPNESCIIIARGQDCERCQLFQSPLQAIPVQASDCDIARCERSIDAHGMSGLLSYLAIHTFPSDAGV